MTFTTHLIVVFQNKFKACEKTKPYLKGYEFDFVKSLNLQEIFELELRKRYPKLTSIPARPFGVIRSRRVRKRNLFDADISDHLLMFGKHFSIFYIYLQFGRRSKNRETFLLLLWHLYWKRSFHSYTFVLSLLLNSLCPGGPLKYH